MKIFLAVLILAVNFNAYSQMNSKGNPQFNNIYNYALQGDVTKALQFIETIPDSTLSPEQITSKQKFIARFKNNNDTYSYNTSDTAILNLIELYRPYWKSVLLRKVNEDTAEKNLKEKVSEYIYKKYFEARNISKSQIDTEYSDYVQKFLSAHGCKAATGKTANLYDLLLWGKESPTDYNVTLPEGNVNVRVVFMDDVVTMGWEDYATLGKYYPGGWATDKELFCVRNAYDTTTENFRVSYLQHEGQHFSDYKIFPKLTGPDLEYRAKLVELIYANQTLYNTINFFIKNSNYDRNNPHAYACFCLIRDMSKKLFDGKTEEDIGKWKSIPIEKINDTAKELLIENTKLLKQQGADTVSEFIK